LVRFANILAAVTIEYVRCQRTNALQRRCEQRELHDSFSPHVSLKIPASFANCRRRTRSNRQVFSGMRDWRASFGFLPSNQAERN
jgi:hypothetical protein